MFNQYLSITKIFVDLYTYPDTYKIIEYNNENIITADIKKILSVLKFENPKVNYFIKLLKDIFKSDLLHRKYLVVLLNNLFLFKPDIEKEDIIDLFKKSMTEIEEILDKQVILLENYTNQEIFSMICRYYPEYLVKDLLEIKRIDYIKNKAIYKIKK